MPRDLFRLLEVSTYQRCAVFVHVHIRNVPDSELGRALRGALLIAEYEDVDIGMQTCPALDRVALNHLDVPEERLRQREERDHCRPWWFRDRRSNVSPSRHGCGVVRVLD